MKYTTTSPDVFQHLQMNAGIIAATFDPETGEFDDILGATTGGISFSATPEFSDFGEDIDNIPPNMLELKKQSSVAVTASGTFVSVTAALAKQLAGAADVTEDGDLIKIVPRKDLLKSDFKTIWLIGDYSDINTGTRAGYLAIKIINALSTGGFQIQTADSGKGNFAFEYTGHYSLENQDQVPYEIYVRQGAEEEPPVVPTRFTIAGGSYTPYPITAGTSDYTITGASDGENTTITIEVANDTITPTITIDGTQKSLTEGTPGVEGRKLYTTDHTWGAAESIVVLTLTKAGRTDSYTLTKPAE